MPPVAPRVPAAPSYWPALDGLRALAVVAVFLLHNGLWVTIHNGGYGVEIFFVISGFLITGLLVDEYARSRRISLRRFWGRRVRRLVPPLVHRLVSRAGHTTATRFNAGSTSFKTSIKDTVQETLAT